MVKYGLLMLPWAFPDIETPSIDFTNLAYIYIVYIYISYIYIYIYISSVLVTVENT